MKSLTAFSSQGARPFQEDFVLAHWERGIFAVADGFGGPGAGPEAARLACESVQSFLEKEAGDLEATLPFVLKSYYSLAGNVLFNSILHANQRLVRLNRGKSVNERGGASLLAGYLDGSLLALANVGACSGWLFRDGGLTELVRPRTYSRLSDPWAEDTQRDTPLMAVGMVADLEPEIIEVQTRGGDWLLLQTDGIGPQMRERLRELQGAAAGSAESLALSAREATGLLKEGQYQDNAAAVLVGF